MLVNLAESLTVIIKLIIYVIQVADRFADRFVGRKMFFFLKKA